MCWWPASLTLILLAVSLLLSAFFYDFSWDGQWYHQLGIITIAREWNPLSDPMRSFAGSPSRLHSQLYLWHYAKGPWYAAATIFATTGRIELGKCINWLILMASFLGTLAACLNGGWRRSRALAIAAVVALNPVAICEITSFLVDGVMASSLVLAVVAIVTALRQPRPAVVATAVAASIVCINSKFTGLVYLCFLLAAAVTLVSFRSAPIAGRDLRMPLSERLFSAPASGVTTPTSPIPGTGISLFYPILGSANYPSLSAQGNDGNEKWETPKNMVGRTDSRPVPVLHLRPARQSAVS